MKRYFTQFKNLGISEVAERRSLIENLFCEIVQILQVGTYAQVYFSIQLHPLDMQRY